MSLVYTEGKRALLAGELDFDEAGNDIRVLLVMTNTTADTEEDVATIAGFTTLDECDASSGYTSGGIALGSQVTAADAINNRGEFDASDVTWSGINGATRQIQGALVYKWNGTLGSSTPIAFIDTGGFPFTPNGSNLTIQWNAEGILQATRAAGTNFVYTEALRAFLAGQLDLNADDIRVLLVMTLSTTVVQEDATTFAGFTLLDEFVGANYVSGGLALAAEAVAADNANNRGEFSASNAVFVNLGTSVRQVQAAIVYKWNGTLDSSMPIAYIADAGFPFTANGSTVTLQWNGEGILQAT